MTVRLRYLGVAVCLLLAGCDKSDNSDFAKVLQFEGAISPSGNRDPIPEHFLQIPNDHAAEIIRLLRGTKDHDGFWFEESFEVFGTQFISPDHK